MSFHNNRGTWGAVGAAVVTAVAAYFSAGSSLAYEGGAAAAAEGAGAAAGVGAEAAGAAGATTFADAAATSSLAGGATAANSYATYAAMAAQALGGVGAYQSATNQAEAAKYNAGLGVANAQLASMQAGAAEDAQRRKASLVLGEQRAAFAGSGVDPSSGTGLLVQEQSSRNAELDALNIRYQGLLTGRGLLAQSELDTRQSQIFTQNANLSAVNTPLSVFGSYQQGKGQYLRQRGMAGAGYGYGGY
jgi:hypothetical protein